MPPPQHKLLSSSSTWTTTPIATLRLNLLSFLLFLLLPLSVPSSSSSSAANPHWVIQEEEICPSARAWVTRPGSFCTTLWHSPYLSNQTELERREARALTAYCEVDRILERFDCSQEFSVNVKRGQCKLCRQAYREWACAMVSDTLEDGQLDCETKLMPCPSCASICHQVMRLCPYLSPDRMQFDSNGQNLPQVSQYGGHPAFYCPLENDDPSDPAYTSLCFHSSSASDPDYVHNICTNPPIHQRKHRDKRRSASSSEHDFDHGHNHVPQESYDLDSDSSLNGNHFYPFTTCCWTYASSVVQFIHTQDFPKYGSDSYFKSILYNSTSTPITDNRVILNCCAANSTCNSRDPDEEEEPSPPPIILPPSRVNKSEVKSYTRKRSSEQLAIEEEIELDIDKNFLEDGGSGLKTIPAGDLPNPTHIPQTFVSASSSSSASSDEDEDYDDDHYLDTEPDGGSSVPEQLLLEEVAGVDLDTKFYSSVPSKVQHSTTTPIATTTKIKTTSSSGGGQGTTTSTTTSYNPPQFSPPSSKATTTSSSDNSNNKNNNKQVILGESESVHKKRTNVISDRTLQISSSSEDSSEEEEDDEEEEDSESSFIFLKDSSQLPSSSSSSSSAASSSSSPRPQPSFLISVFRFVFVGIIWSFFPFTNFRPTSYLPKVKLKKAAAAAFAAFSKLSLQSVLLTANKLTFNYSNFSSINVWSGSRVVALGKRRRKNDDNNFRIRNVKYLSRRKFKIEGEGSEHFSVGNCPSSCSINYLRKVGTCIHLKLLETDYYKCTSSTNNFQLGRIRLKQDSIGSAQLLYSKGYKQRLVSTHRHYYYTLIVSYKHCKATRPRRRRNNDSFFFSLCKFCPNLCHFRHRLIRRQQTLRFFRSNKNYWNINESCDFRLILKCLTLKNLQGQGQSKKYTIRLKDYSNLDQVYYHEIFKVLLKRRTRTLKLLWADAAAAANNYTHRHNYDKPTIISSSSGSGRESILSRNVCASYLLSWCCFSIKISTSGSEPLTKTLAKDWR